MSRFSRIVLPILLFSFLGLPVSAENGTRVLRISVENRDTHFQVRMVRHFSRLAETAAGGAVSIEVYDGAALFRDADVVPALVQGKVEMAVPGIWQLDRFVPDFACLMLPSVFGRTEKELGRVVDSDLGSYLSRSLEKALPVFVLGRWMELGSAHTFFLGAALRDYRGLRVRVPGGAANAERVKALGASPLTIPWPDLPSYLSRSLVDAVVTSYETIASAKLQTAGIEAVLEESQYIGYYVPMFNRRFWESLDDRTRSALIDAWEATVDLARTEARQAQANAKRTLLADGVRLFVPSSLETERTRNALLRSEKVIAERVHVSDEALGYLRRAFDKEMK